MKVFLKEINSEKIYGVTTNINQDTFSFNNIPDGKYVVFVYELDSTGKMLPNGGGFTAAVPCGLTVDCKDHSLIQIEVKNGGYEDSIKISDWYGAILPPVIDESTK